MTEQRHIEIAELFKQLQEDFPEQLAAFKGLSRVLERDGAIDSKTKDLILVAGNVRDAAYTKEAELVRFDIVNGKTVESSVINFDVHRALEGDPSDNLKLQPLDFVNIKQIPDWWDQKKTG